MHTSLFCFRALCYAELLSWTKTSFWLISKDKTNPFPLFFTELKIWELQPKSPETEARPKSELVQFLILALFQPMPQVKRQRPTLQQKRGVYSLSLDCPPTRPLNLPRQSKRLTRLSVWHLPIWKELEQGLIRRRPLFLLSQKETLLCPQPRGYLWMVLLEFRSIKFEVHRDFSKLDIRPRVIVMPLE